LDENNDYIGRNIVMKFLWIGILIGGILCFFIICHCNAGDLDCGCGTNSMTDPFGWDSQGSDGSADPGSSHGGADGGPSDSGNNPGTSTSDSSSVISTDDSLGSTASISGSDSSSDSSGSLISQSLIIFHKGEMNQSLDMLNKSLSLDPYSVRAWMIKGDVMSAMGRYIEAAGAYSQVLHLDPSDGEAAAKRGDAFMNAGQYTDAIASYDRAITMDPGNSGIQSNRSLAKQLASGIIRTNLSVTGPNVTVEPDSGRDLTSETLPGSIPATGQPLVSLVPGTTKAPASIPILLLAIVTAGALLICIRKH
jgi:hypothetical protein